WLSAWICSNSAAASARLKQYRPMRNTMSPLEGPVFPTKRLLALDAGKRRASHHKASPSVQYNADCAQKGKSADFADFRRLKEPHAKPPRAPRRRGVALPGNIFTSYRRIASTSILCALRGFA